ncbi:hypothetical protein LINPERPRIM_LOCUS30189 [Linum perenne]
METGGSCGKRMSHQKLSTTCGDWHVRLCPLELHFGTEEWRWILIVGAAAVR